MRPELVPAINALEEELTAVMRQAGELRSTINMLCRRAGIESRYAEERSTEGSTSTQIKPDTFYGKKMQTAAREFLEIRKRSEMGPAKPKEIFDALSAGGFQFEAKDETTALISLRAMLRKNSATFHKLPNGQYGLRAWYPNAKISKQDDDEEISKETHRRKAAKKRRKPTHKEPKSEVNQSAVTPEGQARDLAEGKPDFQNFVIGALKEGSNPLARLVEKAAKGGLAVPEGGSLARSINATLQGMLRHGVVRRDGDNWALMQPSKTAQVA